MWKPETICVR
uniref:Uncharacterized protein n=1 Tax=Anguilla anguilla TaxID=7936 RepID=A0A0E9PLY7_ANGAN